MRSAGKGTWGERPSAHPRARPSRLRANSQRSARETYVVAKRPMGEFVNPEASRQVGSDSKHAYYPRANGNVRHGSRPDAGERSANFVFFQGAGNHSQSVNLSTAKPSPGAVISNLPASIATVEGFFGHRNREFRFRTSTELEPGAVGLRMIFLGNEEELLVCAG